MNIFLIGMPGVGKTTLGKKLAEKMGYSFLDLDQYIEQQATLFIDELFMLYGEDYFRALETNCLKQVSQFDHYVIACGGGIICRSENKDWMKGICVYLTAPFEEMERRIEGSESIRPLLERKTVEQLYEERKEGYERFSDITIENIHIDDTVNQLVIQLGSMIK